MKIEELYLKVFSPEKVFFEGEIKSLTSINEDGRFDVLSEHANFISIIRETLVISHKNGENQEIKIDGGVIKVHENKISVYLGIEAEPFMNPKELASKSSRVGELIAKLRKV